MKFSSLTGLLLLAALAPLACNEQPRINQGATGGRGGSGAGGSSTGGSSGGGTSGGGQGGGSSVDAFVIPDLSGGAGGSGSGGDANAAVDERMCGLENFNLAKVPPEVMLVLDRSSSMDRMPVGGMVGATLWSDALAAVDEVVKNTAMGVHWGLKMFPVPTGCMVSEGAEVQVMANNYDPILMAARTAGYNMGPAFGTPTDTAMINATTYLKGRTTPNPKYIVLATDGEPSCAAGSTAGGSRMAALDAITAAVGAGFKTYVIGIAIDTVGTGHMILNDMATAGGIPRNDPMFKYFPAANKADLVTALTAITGQVTNCVFPLSRPPPVPDNVKVTVDGMRVNQSATDGWSYTNAQMTAIQFNGPACEAIKTRMAQVSIVFGCPGVVIP